MSCPTNPSSPALAPFSLRFIQYIRFSRRHIPVFLPCLVFPFNALTTVAFFLKFVQHLLSIFHLHATSYLTKTHYPSSHVKQLANTPSQREHVISAQPSDLVSNTFVYHVLTHLIAHSQGRPNRLVVYPPVYKKPQFYSHCSGTAPLFDLPLPSRSKRDSMFLADDHSKKQAC